MKQKHLAELADLELYQVSNIVTGMQKDMLLSTAKKICNALNITLDEAFGDIKK
jgi:DNA-binding Xre family transcriptional regulator